MGPFACFPNSTWKSTSATEQVEKRCSIMFPTFKEVETMFSKISILVVVLVAAALLLSCGGQRTAIPSGKDAPVWVVKTPEESDAIYAVGAANIGTNPVLARDKAADAARQELGRRIETKVKSMLDNFMTEHADLIDSEGNVSSSEFTRSVSRTVSNATLVGSRIESYWHDQSNRIYYALGIISLNDVANQLLSKTSSAAREKKAAFLEEKTNEALELLNKEIQNWDASQ